MLLPNRCRLFLPFVAVGLLSVLSAGAEETKTAQAPQTSTGPAAGEAAYVYKAGSRDPFIPLAGQGQFTSGIASAHGQGEFSPSSLELTGILKTRTGRWAVLRGAGGTYLVRDGKIQDSKSKPVKGYVGIVKEKSLVVIGPDNQLTELKLKTAGESDSKTP